MSENVSMTNAEYRFSCIVWENEPIASPELCKLCEKQLGWKRTTTYTVLKRLCDRSLMQNNSAIVTSLVKKSQILKDASQMIVVDRFNDQLPQFIASFLNGISISAEEAGQIKAMLDQHQEG